VIEREREGGDGPEEVCLEGLDGVVLVRLWRCWTCKVIDLDSGVSDRGIRERNEDVLGRLLP
jgi:hypothetical protein